MDNGTITIETKSISRPAYKGKFLFWRAAAIIAIVVWVVTAGMLIHAINNREVIWQIPPSSQK